jgi:hypothetical protein
MVSSSSDETHEKTTETNSMTTAPKLLQKTTMEDDATCSKMRNPRLRSDEIWTGKYHRQNICSEAETNKALVDFGQEEFGGSGTLKWLQSDRPYTSKRTGDVLQKLRCPFHNQPVKCPYVIRVVHTSATATFSIEVGSLQHTHTRDANDVNTDSERRRELNRPGVSMCLKAVLFNSPGKLNVRPTHLVKAARSRGLAVNTRQEKSIVRFQQRQRSKATGLAHGQAESWGGIRAVAERYQKRLIPNFTEHSTYLIGIRCDSGTALLIAVLSTENLLLNAYRQSFWGQPLFFASDASYRLTREGYGLIPVHTVTIEQKTKTIAYAIVSNEDHKTQHFIFRVVKDEIERVVRKHQAAANAV